jgi:MSHA biogenesis protein MshG
MLDWWPALLVLAGGAVFAFRSFVKTPHGKMAWDRTKLRLPIVGKLVLKGALARACRSLALVLKSGVSLLEASAWLHPHISAREMSEDFANHIATFSA